VSGAGSEWKTDQSRPKIEWAGEEREPVVLTGSCTERQRSGERIKLAAQISLSSDSQPS